MFFRDGLQHLSNGGDMGITTGDVLRLKDVESVLQSALSNGESIDAELDKIGCSVDRSTVSGLFRFYGPGNPGVVFGVKLPSGNVMTVELALRLEARRPSTPP